MKAFKLSRRQAIKGIVGTAAISPLVFLWGCGDKQNAISGNLKRMRLQQPWVNDAEFIGYFVAKAKDYYKEVSLDVTNQVGGPDIVPEVRITKGDAEIALTTPDNTLSLVIKQALPLRIIGAQYHKSPLGVVSLGKSKIEGPKDLAGKKVAVPTVNTLSFEAFLRVNQVDPADVKIESYNYDPSPLVDGSVDATLDFVTNVEFTVDSLIAKAVAEKKVKNEQVSSGEMKAKSFLLADFGFELMMDTVVVTDKFLRDNRDAIKRWFKASRRGWQETFENIDPITREYMKPYLKETGRSIESELAFNIRQQPLIANSNGIYFMSPESIKKTVISLNQIGIQATPEMFDNSLVAEIG